MSQWGLLPETLARFDPVQQAELVTAYLRRARFEARLQAVEVVNMLGQAMTKGDKTRQRVAPEALLAELGMKL